MSCGPIYALRLKHHFFVDSVNSNFVYNLFLSPRLCQNKARACFGHHLSVCVCECCFVCLSVCLGVNRFNFSTTSPIFHKFGTNFLPLDGTPTLCCLLRFLQPVVLSSDMAGLGVCEVGVTVTCFTVVPSLRT